MKFFKNLFGKKIKEEINENVEGANFEGIGSTEDFEERYQPDTLVADILDNCLKMVESYFMDAKAERDTNLPIHHPTTLDATVEEGLGFELYCKAMDFDRNKAALVLSYAFSDYLIKEYDFKLYKDKEPEYPLRVMTLKYDKDGAFLSIYPYEYAVKVLDFEANFTGLMTKIDTGLGQLAAVKKQVDDFIKE